MVSNTGIYNMIKFYQEVSYQFIELFLVGKINCSFNLIILEKSVAMARTANKSASKRKRADPKKREDPKKKTKKDIESEEENYSEEDEDYDEDEDVEEVVEPKAKKAKGPGRPIGSKNVIKLIEAIAIRWDIEDPENNPLGNFHKLADMARLDNICEINEAKLSRDDVKFYLINIIFDFIL